MLDDFTHTFVLTLLEKISENFRIPSVLHLTCANKSLVELDQLLDQVEAMQIKNLFLVRGDLEQKQSYLNHTDEFVSFVRDRFGSDLTIGVGGYPG